MPSELRPDVAGWAEVERAMARALLPEGAPTLLPALITKIQEMQRAAVECRFEQSGQRFEEALAMVAAARAEHGWAALLPARSFLLRSMEHSGAATVPAARLGALLADIAAPGAGPAPAGGGYAHSLRRQHFREAVAAEGLLDVPLVSLGAHCLSWNLPARWGFHGGPQAMRAFCPFSLAVHQLELVATVLEQGWARYAPAELLRVVVTPDQTRMVGRRDGQAVWNHHIGDHWFAEDFAAFRADMAARAAQFDSLCAEPGGPLLVFLLEAPGHIDAALLAAWSARFHAALVARVKGARACLFTLQLPREGTEPYATWPAPGRAILSLPLPRPNYTWHLPAELTGAEGTAWEERIAAALREAMTAWRRESA